MDKIKLIKRVDKLNFVLAISNFILWTGLFMSIFLVDYNIFALKRLGLGATFVVVMDIAIDILKYRPRKLKAGE